MASRGGIEDALRHLYRVKLKLLIAHAQHKCRLLIPCTGVHFSVMLTVVRT